MGGEEVMEGEEVSGEGGGKWEEIREGKGRVRGEGRR